MGIVAVNPTIPVANDIILGEFKCYLNYGLPTQTLLGATRDGCKVKLDRKIKEIEYDGAYGCTLDSDGVPLVRYEEFQGRLVINNLYLKYFNRDVISNSENVANSNDLWESQNWGSSGGAYAKDTTNVLEGDASAQCTADTIGHGIKNVFTTAKDLTVFANGEVSDTDDYIGWGLYISSQDLTDLGSAYLRLAFHNDAEGTSDNYFYYFMTPSALSAGWNTFKVKKSAISPVGSPVWSNISGLELSIDSTAPSAEVVCSIDAVDLIQDNSDSSIVPVNGGEFDVTDETSYKKYVPNLDISDSDFLENVTLIGQKADGYKIKIEAKDVYNDGKIELALEDKDELVNETQFTGHYKQSNGISIPISIYEYVA